jgi:hypothetical protein
MPTGLRKAYTIIQYTIDPRLNLQMGYQQLWATAANFTSAPFTTTREK